MLSTGALARIALGLLIVAAQHGAAPVSILELVPCVAASQSIACPHTR
jgi:hypothetical protein